MIEGGGNISVGEAEGLVGVVAVQEERAVGCLAVARRPDLPGAVERACLALDEESVACAALRLSERSIPPVAAQIGGRVDVEDRGAWTGLRADNSRRKPLGGVVAKARPGDPGIGLGIVRTA